MQTKLAALRRYKNLSQKYMAELIGVETETYSNKERGVTQFKSSEMFIIAKEFGMKIDEIFLPPDFMNHEAKEESKVI
ncbi:helix-turn-helix transcriptional regulator [Siminovitchia fortis]|uniref:XRE family transcriptional regulator n=1 Tax=Siminovitchia fortis TaxID=254758 RepID=A0A443IMZ5_9BACI|nr:helix-turn-helix transcriptional regulator [Siminovitchia fortis]RWR06706.1 XRE family transcriptional regulator [Siminovitchia fortis]WHY82971.1 helix-turn-helix transcriptional regulator [Siminovitchia fortis]